MSESDESKQCPRCSGLGVVSVYYGNFGGSVDCKLCDGEGQVPKYE